MNNDNLLILYPILHRNNGKIKLKKNKEVEHWKVLVYIYASVTFEWLSPRARIRLREQ